MKLKNVWVLLFIGINQTLYSSAEPVVRASNIAPYENYDQCKEAICCFLRNFQSVESFDGIDTDILLKSTVDSVFVDGKDITPRVALMVSIIDFIRGGITDDVTTKAFYHDLAYEKELRENNSSRDDKTGGIYLKIIVSIMDFISESSDIGALCAEVYQLRLLLIKQVWGWWVKEGFSGNSLIENAFHESLREVGGEGEIKYYYNRKPKKDRKALLQEINHIKVAIALETCPSGYHVESSIDYGDLPKKHELLRPVYIVDVMRSFHFYLVNKLWPEIKDRLLSKACGSEKTFLEQVIHEFELVHAFNVVGGAAVRGGAGGGVGAAAGATPTALKKKKKKK
jgi:hypothetical protein